MRDPGRHGSIPSGELEQIISRNGQYISVRRAGSGDGLAGVVHAITGEFILGLGGGRIPEWSNMRDVAPRLTRGWRNIMYELLHRRRIRPTREIRRLLGDRAVRDAMDYGMTAQPMATPEPISIYLDGSTASGVSTR
jgi:hypothetical protein